VWHELFHVTIDIPKFESHFPVRNDGIVTVISYLYAGVKVIAF